MNGNEPWGVSVPIRAVAVLSFQVTECVTLQWRIGCWTKGLNTDRQTECHFNFIYFIGHVCNVLAK